MWGPLFADNGGYGLFMLPEVDHCGGSTGPSAIGGGMPEPANMQRAPDTHVVSALMRWVEPVSNASRRPRTSCRPTRPTSC